jgi:hypothetical protein
MAKIIRLITGALILFAILFLINGFAGKCTKRCGVAYGKHTLESAEGKRFYRIYVKGDSNVLDVQTQHWDYSSINAGDSVCYTIRYGLFTQSIIEMYNAQKK